MVYETYYDSPIGILKIVGTEQGVTAVQFVEKKTDPDPAIMKKYDRKELAHKLMGHIAEL